MRTRFKVESKNQIDGAKKSYNVKLGVVPGAWQPKPGQGEVNPAQPDPETQYSDPAIADTADTRAAESRHWDTQPGGSIELQMLSAHAAAFFEEGAEYLVDFAKAQTRSTDRGNESAR